MAISVSNEGKVVTIKVRGRFDFSHKNEFCSVYESYSSAQKFIVDLSTANHLDSAALGMLLLLLDYVDKDKSRAVLAQANAEIKSTLLLSHFDELFIIT